MGGRCLIVCILRRVFNFSCSFSRYLSGIATSFLVVLLPVHSSLIFFFSITLSIMLGIRIHVLRTSVVVQVPARYEARDVDAERNSGCIAYCAIVT
jgi:hypothetical protein